MTTQVTVPGDRSEWSGSDLNKMSDAVVELQGVANGGSIPAIDGRLYVTADGALPLGGPATGTDNTTGLTNAIAATIAAAKTSGGIARLVLPAGYIAITGNISISDRSVRILIEGAGMEQAATATQNWTGTCIIRSAGTGALFTVVGNASEQASISLKGLGFNANGVNGDLLVLDHCSNVLLENVSLRYTTGIGLKCSKVYNSNFRGVYVFSCGTTTTSPAVLFTAPTGEGTGAGCSMIRCTDFHWLNNTGTEVKISGSTGDSAPADSIQFVNFLIERVTQTNNYPCVDFDYSQSGKFVAGRVRIDGAADPSLAVSQKGTSTGYPNSLTDVTIDYAGTPTYIVEQTVGRLALDNVKIIGTPATAQYHVGSSVPAGGAVVRGFYTNVASTLRFLDDRTRANGGELGKGTVQVERWSGVATAGLVNDWSEWEFTHAGAADDYAGEVQVPEDVVPGSTVSFRLIWTIASGLTGNVVWDVLSQTADTGTATATASTRYPGTSAGFAIGSASTVQITDIVGPAVNPGQILQVRLRRLGTNGNDTAAANARLFRLAVLYDRAL